MSNTRLLHRPAIAAIAAVLASTATPILAQDVSTPPLVLPDEPVSTPVAPAIVLPEPVVVPDAPVVAAEPAAPAATTSVARREPVSRTAAPQTRNSTAVARTANEQDALPVAPAPLPAAATEQQSAAEAVSAPAPVAVADPAPDRTEMLAKVIGGLLIAGAAGFGLLALGRRRKRTVERDIERRVASPLVEGRPAFTPVPAPRAYDPPRPTPVFRQQAAGLGTASGSLPNQGAAVALPREAPTDFEERSALLKRMVDAQPDKANPFTSPKARLRRARLILQSLGRKFENVDPRIDLSDYTSNWPALARRNRTSFA